MNSWITTIFGLLAAIGGAVIGALTTGTIDPAALPHWVKEVALLMFIIGSAGVGFAARDNGKSSEDVGAKPDSIAAAVMSAKNNQGFASVKMLFLMFLCSVVLFHLAGCAIPKDIAHVYHISGDGTSVGVTQNPTTQAYELGLKRVHTTLTIVPIVFQTNSMGGISAIIPDTVVSDEINARSGVFGGAGGTITLATGSNAVQTLLGGQHVPINAGTGSNLPK